MKTRRFAIAFERGRVGARSAQACGFVSRTITSSEGVGPGYDQIYEFTRPACLQRAFSTNLDSSFHNALSHLQRSWRSLQDDAQHISSVEGRDDMCALLKNDLREHE